LQIDDSTATNNENNKDQNITDKKLFTIQYTKEELDKIQIDFLEQINNYIVKVNNNHSIIIKTIEEIKKRSSRH
jgi:hypothetical protein